jgi:hypothetical protein
MTFAAILSDGHPKHFDLRANIDAIARDGFREGDVWLRSPRSLATSLLREAQGFKGFGVIPKALHA